MTKSVEILLSVILSSILVHQISLGCRPSSLNVAPQPPPSPPEVPPEESLPDPPQEPEQSLPEDIPGAAPVPEVEEEVEEECGVSEYYRLLEINSFPVDSINDGKIIGGEVADPTEFPWLVRLVIDDVYICGASIISSEHLLTAAHCVRGVSDPSYITAHFGDWDINRHDSFERIVPVAEIITHGDYNSPTAKNNDIAILRLEEHVDISDSSDYKKICLPDDYTDCSSTGTELLIAGWGTTTDGDVSPSRYLMRAWVNVFDQAECESNYLEAKGWVIQDSMICARGFGGSDTCQGDSGGPLMLLEDGHFKVCGVTSFGHKCGHEEYPGVYSKVAKNLAWIESVIDG